MSRMYGYQQGAILQLICCYPDEADSFNKIHCIKPDFEMNKSFRKFRKLIVSN